VNFGIILNNLLKRFLNIFIHSLIMAYEVIIIKKASDAISRLGYHTLPGRYESGYKGREEGIIGAVLAREFRIPREYIGLAVTLVQNNDGYARKINYRRSGLEAKPRAKPKQLRLALSNPPMSDWDSHLTRDGKKKRKK